MIRSRDLAALAVMALAGLCVAGSPAAGTPRLVVADPSASATPVDDCNLGAIYGDHASGINTARVAGTPVTSSIVVHNRSTAAKTGMTLKVNFIILATSSNPGPPPTVDWSSDGGSWHRVTEHFAAGSNGQQPTWNSSGVAAPTFAAHSQHTFRLRVTFTKGIALGEYSGGFYFASATCSGLVDEAGPLDFYNNVPLVTVHTAAHHQDPVTPAPTTAAPAVVRPATSPTSTATPIAAPAPATDPDMTTTPIALPANPAAASVHTRTIRIDTGVGVATLFVVLSLIQFFRWRRFRAS